MNPFQPDEPRSGGGSRTPFNPPPPTPPSAPQERRWPTFVPWVIAALLLAVAALLGFREWTTRQTLASQARDLAGLRDKVEILSQTNQLWRAESERASASLEKSERERERIQQEALRLQAEFKRLEDEQRAVAESKSKLEADMREALQSRDVTISELAGKLTVNILDRVLFASGEADVKAEGQEVLRRVAGVLKQFPDRQIQVIGHTDNVPIHTARFPSNWELSTARAMAAVRFLTEQAGVDPGRLGAVGQGEFHPVADNGTPEGRAQNRRIAIVVLPELFKANPEAVTPPPAPPEPGTR